MENDSRLSTALLNENREQDEQSKKKSENEGFDANGSNGFNTTTPEKPNLPTSFTKVKSSFKIIVLGDSGVGKTCLSFRFCAGRFPLTSEATIGLDFREKIIELDGLRLKLQLWDTAGQERFRRSITHHYYRNVDAVVFVYDVNSVSSFEGLDVWLEEVNVHGIPEAVPRILVGNKCDMGAAAVDTREAQRRSSALYRHVRGSCEGVAGDGARLIPLSFRSLYGVQAIHFNAYLRTVLVLVLYADLHTIVIFGVPGALRDLGHNVILGSCWSTWSTATPRGASLGWYAPPVLPPPPTPIHQGGHRRGHRWADDRNMPLFETSAKDDTLADHVDGIFLTLAHKVRHKKPLIRPVTDPCSPGATPVRLVYQSHLAGANDQPEPGCCF